MAKLNKICNSNFDLERGVIIYGKGDFDPKIIDKSRRPYIASLNTGATLHEDEIDFLFINDIETIHQVKKAPFDFNNINNIISPIQPHSRMKPHPDITYNNILDILEQIDTTVYTFRLHSQKTEVYIDLNKQDNYRFGKIITVYHTALWWLLLAGFTRFDICGVSKRGEYQKEFVTERIEFEESLRVRHAPVKKPDALYYTRNYEDGINILTMASYFSIKPIVYNIHKAKKRRRARNWGQLMLGLEPSYEKLINEKPKNLL